MGLLTEGAPCTVEVCGQEVRVLTDWRVWMTAWQAVDDPALEPMEKLAAVIALAYPSDGERPTPHEVAVAHPAEAFESALHFLRRTREGEPDRPKTRMERRLDGKRLFDFDYDASRIAADFEREYGIDLTAEGTCMHWHRFMALFNGLSDRSQIVNAISTRAADLNDKGLGREQKKALRERKMALMLPARTPEEAAENRRIRGM